MRVCRRGAAALLSTAALAATPAPASGDVSGAAAEPRAEAPAPRTMPTIWGDVVEQRRRLLRTAQGEIEESHLAEMEQATVRLLELMAEIRGTLDYDDLAELRVERAIRFVILRARRLERTARLRIPGPVPRTLPYLDEQLYVLEQSFPDGALGDVALPPRETPDR